MDGCRGAGFPFAVGSSGWSIQGGVLLTGKLPGPLTVTGLKNLKQLEFYVLMPLNKTQDVIVEV